MRNLLLTLRFALLLLMLLGTASLAWAHDFEVDGIYYNIRGDNTVAVTFQGTSYSSYSDEYIGTVTIPRTVTYSGTTYAVTTIGDWAFRGCTGLAEVTIPDAVTTIGIYAFYGCTGLTEVMIPDAVTTIGMNVFSGCTGLTVVTIGSSVTSIGFSAFEGCLGLKMVYFNAENCGDFSSNSYAHQFYNCPVEHLIIGDNVKTIPGYLARDLKALTEVTIGSSVTAIGYNAFEGCTGLRKITVNSGNSVYDSRNNCNAIIESATNTLIQGCQNTIIPNSVTSIGERAFYECTGLTEVTISDAVTTIGNEAFYGCSGLTELTIGSSVTSIGVSSFSGCSGLTEVTIPDAVTTIDNEAFYGCTGLTELTIGGSVTYIGNSAFSGCTGLTEVTIPDAVTTIGNEAFYGCTGLTELTIGSSVTSIGVSSFSGCTGLTEVTIPDAVASIGDSSFSGCTGLKTVYYNAKSCSKFNSGNFNHPFHNCPIEQIVIGNNVKTIPQNFAYNLTRLTNITIPDAVTSIGGHAFYCCTRLKTVYYNAKSCSQFSSGTSHPFYNCSVKQILIGNNVTTIPGNFAYNLTGLTGITIPDAVTLIGQSAFSGCTGLTSITIPDVVTSIGSSAFSGCTGLTSITIPDVVTSIGSSAFSGCTGLKTVYYNAKSCSQFSSGTSHPFYNCSVKQILIGNNVTTIPGNFAYNLTGLTSITIPDAVTLIGQSAFSSCTGLTSITIPDAVTSIGSSAFSGCTGLKTVYYNAKLCSQFSSGTSHPFYNCTVKQILIGNNVTTIPGNFAYNFTGLTSITIPDAVTSIGISAFSGCTGLAEVTIPDAVTTIGDYAFSGCTGLTSITIPDAVTSIGQSTFSGCTGLTNVSIGAGVTTIGQYAFYGCTGLTSITIPDAVTSIGQSAFSGCTALKKINFNAKSCGNFGSGNNHPFRNCPIDQIVIGNNVTIIPSCFAYSLTGLTSITIPDAVTSIGLSAFYGCTGLKRVISWAFDPPSLGYSAFYGVPSSMCVFVPAISVDDYKKAAQWNQFEILPIDDNSINLTINIFGIDNVGDYSNMNLEISDANSGKSLHYSLTDKTSYSFNVEKNSTWNVTLSNQYGDVFGKIENVNVGEEDVTVTFPPLLKPQDVTLTVKTPNGQDVTSQCKVSWLNENGELLTQGNQIGKLPAGRKLKYQVTLPQELATAYTLPATNTYTVKSGSNDVVCQLAAISQTQLSGKVKDASNNQPLYGATLSAVQSFGGDVTKTITAKTDHQGQYSLDASSVPTTLTVAASGYMSQTVECDMTGGNTVVVPDVALSPITGAVINVNLTYTPAHLESEQAEVQNWYSDYSNVDYEVYNKTTGRSMTGVHVQYPQIVLTEDVNDGDVLELTATSRKDAFKPVKTTVTIAEQRATATFNILEKGKVAAKFRKNINPSVVGTLYDADKKMVKSDNYTGETLTINDLADGNYKLVTMGKSDFFNSIYDMDQFAATGLQSGVDYAENAVTVATGLISPVNINEVPFLDETKLYYTGENTSFTVNKSNIVIGNYLTFRSEVDFKDAYKDKVNDVQIIVDLPESCHFYENSVMVESNMGGYTVEDNRIVIPIANYENHVVRFCAIPTEIGDVNSSAFVQFKLNGKTITQPIGKANFHVESISSLIVPPTTASTTISVGGTALTNCQIDIYDNDVLIGHTTANANSKWLTQCELHQPYNLSRHSIYAIITTTSGIQVPTEKSICIYDKNEPQVSKVTQYNEQRGPTPYLVTWNFLHPSLSSQHYSYDMYDNHRTFSYTIEFTNNQAVDNVTLYVKTVKGHWWPLVAAYDTEKDVWFTSGEFGNAQNGDLPVNVAVDYQTKSVLELDDSFLQSEYSWINGIETDVTVNDPEDEQSNEYDTLSDQDLLDFLRSQNDSVPNIDGYEGLDSHEFSVNTDDGRTIIIKMCSCSDLSEELVKNDSNYLVMQKTTGLPLYVKRTETVADYIDFENNVRILLAVDSSNSSLSSSALTLNANRDFISTVSGYIVSFSGLINSIDDETRFIRNTLENMKRASSFNYAEAMAKFNKYDGIVKTLEKRIFNAIDPQWKAIWEAELYRAYNLKNLYRRNAEAALKTINNIKAVLGKLSSIFSFSINAKKGYDAMVEWKQILESIQSSECPGMDELYNKACSYTRLIFTFYFCAAKADLASLIALKGKITGVLSLALFNISIHSSNWGDLMQTIWTNEIRNKIPITNNCDPGPDSNNPVQKPKGHKYSGADMTLCIDPSGFVYEGVPSNRLQGVTATCYYKETVEDMYGDPVENVVLWDAEQYGQENPLLTDENGYYRWDVPIGMWQVKYEKEGYETTYSDWLPVPPPQLDVNIGMVQMRQPEVIKARAYPQAVELEFDKFMFPETLTADNITVSVNGTAVPGTIELLNAEVDDPLAITSIRRAPGTGLTFASRVRFNAASPFNATEVTLHVKQDVKSYADLMMNEDYEAVLPVELEMTGIVADSVVVVPYHESKQLTVTVLPAAASAGKVINVASTSTMIATTDAEQYTLDNDGKTVITVHGDLPGATSLVYTIDGYDLTATTLVNVLMESQMTVAAPTATIASGSTVPEGTAVYLRCGTEGATIYYTLDGSCPCDPSPARKVYDGSPIIINGTVTIKAMATAPDLYDSDVATFVYRVGSGMKGDVNGDGEVNIADVNALIDIIAGGAADADTRYRADVNGDGEVNIADINAVIDIILNPANNVELKVNCGDLLHVDDVTMRPGDVRTLQVTLDRAARYSAVQCDLVLPAGLTLVDAHAVGANVMRMGSMDDFTNRVLSYSMNKLPFVGDSQPVMTFTVRADAALAPESEITLTHVVLADAANKAWRTGDCTARVNNATGITDVTVTASRVWVEKHTLCIESSEDGTARIATVSGMVSDLDVKAGITRHELEPGIYVVILGGQSYKISVK